ncbi:MAG: nucleotide exchange factor GrpE [Vicinamibacterales bacterium]
MSDDPIDPNEAGPDAGSHDDPQDAGAAPAGLDAVLKERDALRDQLLRAAADFDNYRKRVDRERRDLVDYAATELIAEVLPVLDDLERALDQPSSPEVAAYRQGVELVHRKMLDLLKKRGVTPIAAAGEMFDPNVHEAVVHEVSDVHEEGTITGELRRGYRLKERLLRPAMVKVAKSS